jgi:hypothetical protein
MVVLSHDERLLKMLPLQAVCGGRADCRMVPMDIAWPNPSAVKFGGNLAFLPDCPLLLVTDLAAVPWVRKFTATPNYLILPPEPIDFLQEGWR